MTAGEFFITPVYQKIRFSRHPQGLLIILIPFPRLMYLVYFHNKVRISIQYRLGKIFIGNLIIQGRVFWETDNEPYRWRVAPFSKWITKEMVMTGTSISGIGRYGQRISNQTYFRQKHMMTVITSFLTFLLSLLLILFRHYGNGYFEKWIDRSETIKVS